MIHLNIKTAFEVTCLLSENFCLQRMYPKRNNFLQRLNMKEYKQYLRLLRKESKERLVMVAVFFVKEKNFTFTLGMFF